MGEEKVYISKIVLKNSQEYSFNYDDIVVFVGSNNVGKSQCLRDIFKLCHTQYKNDSDPIIISSIEKKCENIDVDNYIRMHNIEISNDHTLNILGNRIYSWSASSFLSKKNYGDLRDLFVKNLSTEHRLSITNPVDNKRDEKGLNNPVLYAGYDSKCRKWINNNFNKAFGEDLNANIYDGQTVSLCIGETPKIQPSGKEIEAFDCIDDIRKKMSAYKKVHEQGDGVKSFTGILLYLMIPFYKTFLIDEPESFLHQPQATMMGHIIEEATKNKQCFISTHSEHLIRGLLDSCPNRVKIIRITRKDNENKLHLLNNDDLKAIWSNPLLKHSNIMSGIFYENVVLCESDSDCKLYSIINDSLKEANNHYSNSLFVSCGGKHRIADIAAALRSLNVDLRIVTDIDILNEEKTIKKMVEKMGGDFGLIKNDFKKLSESLNDGGRRKTRNSIKEDFNNLINMSDEKYLSDREIANLKDLFKECSVWSDLKKAGKSYFPSGEPTEAAENIFKELKKINIFVVEIGELECFIRDVSNHGPHWVEDVLKKHPNLDDTAYNLVKEFVNSLNI